MGSPKKPRNQESEKPWPQDNSRRQDTSATSAGKQLPVTTSIGVTSSPTGILDSIVGGGVIPHNIAAGDILGRTACAAGTAYINELRPKGTAKGSTEFYEMCTESLGFESMSEKMDLSKAIEEYSCKTKMWRVPRDKMRFKDLPPILSSLDSSGRPRFSLEKVRSNGRLNIRKVDHHLDLVGGSGCGGDVAPRTVEMGGDKDQEKDVSCNNFDEMKMIGDRQYDGGGNNEVMAGDEHQEEMIGELDQDGDDGNDVNQ